VVDVRVGEDDRVDARRIERRRRPVAQAQLLEALEEAAIDEDGGAARRDEVLRSGDRPGRAAESKFQDVLATMPWWWAV
jgi:hypothetical protein